jgi:hypothetical protein
MTELPTKNRDLLVHLADGLDSPLGLTIIESLEQVDIDEFFDPVEMTASFLVDNEVLLAFVIGGDSSQVGTFPVRMSTVMAEQLAHRILELLKQRYESTDQTS